MTGFTTPPTDITVTRADRTAESTHGVMTRWDDDTTTYCLSWGESAYMHGWAITSEAEGAIRALEALRTGAERLSDPLFVNSALRDVNALARQLDSLRDALILAGRATSHDGRSVLSWRELGDALGVDHTTVTARHARLAAGERPGTWSWLTIGAVPIPGETPRADHTDAQ